MELIYTRRRTGFEPGKHYRNPRFFDRPEAGATRVTIEGDYPAIAKAYEAIGVSVSKPAQASQAEPEAKAQPEPEQPADAPVDAVESEPKQKRGRPRKSQE